MIANHERAIQVWADWSGAPLSRVGVLSAVRVRGREVFSFEYDQAWLTSEHAFALDPSLSLYPGPHYPAADQANFGVFLDSSPDRWGRVLLERREAQLTREQGRARRQLMESDYLLGVFDGHRMGALRFRLAPEGPFLDDNVELASPPWTALRELENASRQLEQEGSEEHPNYSRWLTMMLAPGRSLGGARPKASVVDHNGWLHIAKFPSTDDDIDVGAWEGVAHELASRAGVDVPTSTCARFASKHHTFISQRFDRTPQGQRLHFASAMTLLQRTDGEASDDVSYLELAEALIQSGAEPSKDLEQLWRRIVLFVCISNVDDHLRNHGFMLTQNGWRLSPAYDINPVAWGEGLSLNISDKDNAQDLRLVREVAEMFRVRKDRANAIIDLVTGVVRGWREVATARGISRRQQTEMERAFRVADAAGP
ncbi:HIPA protein [Enhygromyxa salina]|uniref:HIPA protein n=1 Tax=Enhygromyxa salina TaxID=215803 RepID=A0A0C2DCY6_9BACT|nr:type II toxin-antitoxin system HipA family toxin [Enhygromyxa salina]KIG19270.1 HIPA protein [Enhygromyxa salina]